MAKVQGKEKNKSKSYPIDQVLVRWLHCSCYDNGKRVTVLLPADDVVGMRISFVFSLSPGPNAVARFALTTTSSAKTTLTSTPAM